MSHYIFYKIVCEDCPDYIYIGSTTSFRSRKNQHKGCCNNENHKSHNLKIYKKIREYGGWENWNMIIIDEGKELTFTQARIKEEELRIKYNGNLNSQRAYRTEEEKKQYYEKNKEKLTEQMKEYNEKNKEKIKEYNENNKEKRREYDKEYKEKNKEKIKEYRENNKEKTKEYNKQQYLKNKEEALIKE